MVTFSDAEDYEHTYMRDIFNDRDTFDCNTVPIISDSIDEEEECFTVSLSTTTSLAGLTLNPQIATVCINDDDCKNLIILGFIVVLQQSNVYVLD